jgi:Ca2+-binding RTX toxin-like protein
MQRMPVTGRVDLEALRLRAFRHWSRAHHGKGKGAALFQPLESRWLLSSVAVINGVLTVNADNTSDTINIDPAGGSSVTVNLNGAMSTFGSFTSIKVMGNGGNDKVTINSAIIKPTTLLGGEGNDSLVGGGGNDTLDGGAGADTMKGGNGIDTADYSSRTADLTIGLGTINDDGEAGEHDNVYLDIEQVQSGSGNDSLRASATGSTLFGGFGNDSLFGGAASDSLIGGGGNDRLEGGGLHDALLGGFGSDSLFGNDGDDLLQGDDGSDFLDGGGGIDDGVIDPGDTWVSVEKLNSTNSSGAIVFNNGQLTVTGTDAANDVISLLATAGGNLVVQSNSEYRTFAAVNVNSLHLIGLGGNDSITLGDNISIPASIEGGAGNDTLQGGLGADTLDGGADDDTAITPGNDDTLASIEHTVTGEVPYTISADGLLTVQGTPNADGIIVFGNNPSITILFNGTQYNILNAATTVNKVKILGGGGDDFLSVNVFDVNARPVSVFGEEGNDTLSGGDAAEYFSGGAGDDSISGGINNDTLDGGAGADFLQGNEGNDTADYSSRAANLTIGLGTLADDGEANEHDNVQFDIETVLGGSGNDKINGSAANNLLVGNGGNDSLDGAAGNDTLSGNAGTDTLNGNTGDDTAINSTGDTLISIEHIGGDGGGGGDNGSVVLANRVLTVTGTSGDDVLTYQLGDFVVLNDVQTHVDPTLFDFVVLNGLGGNDTIGSFDPFAHATNHLVTFNGGSGNDSFTLSNAHASIMGGSGNDFLRLQGGWEIDSFTDDGGTETVSMESSIQNDFDMSKYPFLENLIHARGKITGNALNNTISGDDLAPLSNLTLLGGAGNDTLTGGGGNDVLDGGTGADLLKGGGGNDTADYSSRTANLTIGIGTLSDDGEANEHDNVNVDIETVLGGSGNDKITGGAANNLLVGNGGNDSLDGNTGDDTLSGDAGTDTLNGNLGDDTAINSTGDVLISIEHNNPGSTGVPNTAVLQPGGTVLVTGTTGNDIITFSAPTSPDRASFTINGTTFNFDPGSFNKVVIDALAGNDKVTLQNNIAGVTAPFSIDLGEGNDQVQMFEPHLTVSVTGGAGDDSISTIDATAAFFDGGGGTDSIDYDNIDGDNIDMNAIMPNVENAHIVNGTLIGNGLNNNLQADWGGRLEGGAGNDTIQVGGGGFNSTLLGGPGNDTLLGGDNDDTLDGGAGADLMKGGNGLDTVDYSSRSGNLTIGIGTINDDGEENEHDNVWTDIETVLGGSGDDTITGGVNDNLIVGNGGNDSLRGNFGNDTLSGNAGTDTLNGDAGDDTAINSAGDILISIEHVA